MDKEYYLLDLNKSLKTKWRLKKIDVNNEKIIIENYAISISPNNVDGVLCGFFAESLSKEQIDLRIKDLQLPKYFSKVKKWLVEKNSSKIIY